MKLLFVLGEALGWRTYSAQFRNVLRSRSDFDAHVLPFHFARPGAFLLKRTNMPRQHRFFRRRDPIAAMRGTMGAALRAEIQRITPDAVHFGDHLPAAALAWETDRPPFTVALDATRLAIVRDLGRGAWTEAECAREAEMLARAEHIYSASEWAARSVVEDYGLPRERMTHMPWSVDLSRFVPRRPESAGSLPRLLFVGADFARKGGDRLLRWMEGPLRGQCELHIVSGKSPAGASVPGVVFHGQMENDRVISELLPTMDIFCLPTRADMSAWVVIEASAAGLPSVASDVGGIRELIRDGESGRLLAPDDDAGFIAAITELIGDVEMRRRYGRRAQAAVAETADSFQNYNRLIDGLKALAPAPPAAETPSRLAVQAADS